MLVVAGAGSGKTRIITRRVAYLTREGVPPDRILAVTFTNKAADEMRRRVEALVGSDVLVTTFHSLGARILRRNISALGMQPSFSIYDRADSVRVVRQICKEMDLDPGTHSPARLLAQVSHHKSCLEDAAECARTAVAMSEKVAAEVYRRYEERLRASNALDFDDLLVKIIDLFRASPDVLQQYQESYLHVLVDEYQDTNLPQHSIARAVQGKHRNITAVGDPDQMIYTWRGARLENILAFEKDFPGAHVVTLERNYRSTANILRAASVCIRYNEMRREKELWTDSEPGEPVTVLQFADSYEEAEQIAQTVQGLIEDGAPPNEMAILYRTNYQSLPLEEAFASRALPYQVVDTVRFFERKQVKDLRAYVQLLVNPDDDEAFLRIVNVPRRGVGQKTVEQLRRIARKEQKSLLRAAKAPASLDGLGPRPKSALAGFCELYDRLASLEHKTVLSLISQLIKETGYMGSVPAEEREDAQEVIDYLLEYVKQYDRRNPGGGLLGFLEQTALISDVDGLDSGARAVPLMTLHSAKGLEFDVVFITGLEEGILPHDRALTENPYGGERYALEEERRLMHVGVTRARKKLYLTHARRRMIRGQERLVSPSRFLQELPEEGVVREAPGFQPAGTGPPAPFAQERQFVLKQKQPTLRIADDEAGSRLAAGVRVVHPSYGEGMVVETDSAGRYIMVRVDFAEHGVLSLLLSADDVERP